jgi:hypothetical protein
MRKLLAVLVLMAVPVGAADICISGTPDVCYTTTADENKAGLYYQTQFDDALCSSVALPAGCSLAEYAAAGGTETFYARTAQGAKEFFMDLKIKSALAEWVTSYGGDIDTRARDYWNSLTLAQREAQCLAWGFEADCS